jgi:predicted metal-binding membrane protein
MAAVQRFSSFMGDPRAVTLTAIALVCLPLWWLMAMMPQMAVPEGWSVGIAVSTSVMWIVMMLAMMLPSMAPVMSVYAGLAAKEHRGAILALRILSFFGGYFALWAAVSVALAFVQLGLRDSAYFTLGGTQATPLAAGGLLIAAGVYQMTPIKDLCLEHCRSPMAFLLSHWREGLRGAFPMGLRHGLYCVGCCIAIMGLMFVLGAMNPWWMAVIAAYFVAEKLLPAAEQWTRGVGVALILLGSVVILAALTGMEMT